MDFTDRSTRGWAGSLCCLFCPVAKLSIALLFCLTSLLRIGQKPRSSREMHCKATLWILLILSPSSSFPSVNASKGLARFICHRSFFVSVYARSSLQRLPLNALQSSCREGSMSRIINHSGCSSSAPEGLTFSFPAFNKSQAAMAWRLLCAL